MKKLALALMCFASVAFFASCDPVVENPEPSIQVYAQDGFIQNGDTLDYVGDTLYVDFGFVMASNTQTNKKLTSLVVTVDGNQWANKDLTGETSFTYTDQAAFIFTRDEIIGTTTINAVVTDEAGNTNVASILIYFNSPDVALLGMPIEWKREGTTNLDAEEMALLGLQWTGSYKEVFATLKPIEDAALYVCNGDDFDGIETVGAKAAYIANLIETAEPVESYRKITTNNSADYNDMLVTLVGDNAYLIHITHALIEPITNAAGQYLRTDITITGECK
jgi:hypothetical protein